MRATRLRTTGEEAARRPPAVRRRRGPLRKLLLVPYVIIVSVFGVAYSALFLPPKWFWWMGAAAVAVPYLSGALVLLSPLAFWRFGPFGRVVHIALLLLIALRFFMPAGLFAEPEARPDDLVVMTFNAPVRGPSPAELAASTVALVRTEGPDLLALQEPVIWIEDRQGMLPVIRATAHLKAVIDSLAYRSPIPLRKGRAYDLEQPVLARFKTDEYRQIELNAPGAETPTYVTRVRFTYDDRPAVLYNLHLYTVGERKPWQDDEPRPFDPLFWRPYVRAYRAAYLRRAWEVMEIRRLIEEEEVPVIIVGDFNSTIHHWEYRQLAQGLRNAFTTRGQGWGATYHARLPLVRIDHVLASPDFEIVSAHVGTGHPYSDHRPVVARLRWRDEL